MKRIVTIVLILSISLSLTGCKNNVSVNEIYFESLNYNNYYNYRCSCDLWINDDICLYNSDGFYNMRTYAYQNGNKVKLFESRDFINEYYYGEIFPINDFAYFTTSTDDNNQNFYKYSFKNQSYEKLFTINAYNEWMGTADFIAFDKCIGYFNDLYIYNIEKNSQKLICDNTVKYGIVDNKIRYLKFLNENTIELYEYDHINDKSKKLDDIVVKNINEYSTYNFTGDYVTITESDNEDYRKIYVYSSNGITSEYTLPKPVQQFVAGDQYAYALCYETEEYSSTAVKHKDNGIYRINLADGSYDVIETVVDDDTEIHVVSDDEIYITQYKSNFIGQYKGHVHKMIVSDKTKTKIFII
ncbi:MAG: hypothetical protein J6A78_00510 [Clostridia bacterium]|nr:hypothetical protein [Clostridia bacterium]